MDWIVELRYFFQLLLCPLLCPFFFCYSFFTGHNFDDDDLDNKPTLTIKTKPLIGAATEQNNRLNVITRDKRRIAGDKRDQEKHVDIEDIEKNIQSKIDTPKYECADNITSDQCLDNALEQQSSQVSSSRNSESDSSIAPASGKVHCSISLENFLTNRSDS